MIDCIRIYIEVWPVSTMNALSSCFYGKSGSSGLTIENHIVRIDETGERGILKTVSFGKRGETEDPLRRLSEVLSEVGVSCKLYSRVPCNVEQGRYVARDDENWNLSDLPDIHKLINQTEWST